MNPISSPDAPHSAPGGPTIRIRGSGAFELWGVYLGGPADGLNTRDISHSEAFCWRRLGTLLPPLSFQVLRFPPTRRLSARLRTNTVWFSQKSDHGGPPACGPTLSADPEGNVPKVTKDSRILVRDYFSQEISVPTPPIRHSQNHPRRIRMDVMTSQNFFQHDSLKKNFHMIA